MRAHNYKWGYKKALVNSTGKRSLGGPAPTGRAGLGLAARGLGSLHCVYVAAFWTFTAPSLPRSHHPEREGEDGLHASSTLNFLMISTEMTHERLETEAERGAPPAAERPSEVLPNPVFAQDA